MTGSARRLSSSDDRLHTADDLVEVTLDRRLGTRADDRLHDLAAEVDVHRRDAGDAVLHRGLRVLVDVELEDGELVAVLDGELFENRCDLAARTAPLGPEVD